MDIRLYAHRGGMGRAPENTLKSFQQAFSDGADGFEFDVCLTQDKQPVLIHVDFNDDDISIATGCTTPLSELTWEDLQKITMLDSDEPVAHLDDALRFIRENQFPGFLEPKTDIPDILPIILDRIHHFEVSHLVSLLTFDYQKYLLVEVKKLEPQLRTSTIVINPFANFHKVAQEINTDRIIFGWSNINHFNIYNTFFRSIPHKIKRLQENGIVVEAGFIKELKDVAWSLKHGIHGLWVDDVPLIRDYVKQFEYDGSP